MATTDAKSADNPDFVFKLLLIGDSGVGKSSLLLRFCDDTFTPMYITTLGIDYKIKTVNVDKKWVKLQIWDTAGQEKFRTITQSFYRGALGIFVVYDIISDQSFEAVNRWINSIAVSAPENVTVILLANKCDMEKARVVSVASGEELSRSTRVKFFEVSAANGHNVNEAFMTMARDITQKLMAAGPLPEALASGVHLDKKPETQPASSGRKCCRTQ